MKKMLLWLWLLTKRLYKKPTFLVILLLIPLLSFGYGAMTEGDSGMLTVALAAEDPNELTEEIFDSLLGTGQLIQYRVVQTPQEATFLVQTGKADAAWILQDDLENRIATFSLYPERDNAFVKVVQREENVALMLSRERLGGAVYPYIAQHYYLHYIRENLPKLDHLSDEALMEYYVNTEMADNLFSYDHETADVADVHYLMAPVRGLLGIVIVLCGLAAAMYYLHDQRIGTFAWVPARKAFLPELGCQLVALCNVGVVALAALALTGLSERLWQELPVLILYPVCVAAFCMMLRALFGSIRGLGSLLPLLIVVMILVCPVFFDLGKLRLLQFLLPPTYYVNAVYNPMYLLYMALYTLVNFGLYWLLRNIFKR